MSSFLVFKTSLRDDSDKETGQDIKVQEIILHGNYSARSKLNDIALLKLEKDVVLAHNVWPACLSGKHEGLGHNLTIIGFGKKNLDDGSTADWLLKGE